MRRSTWLGRRSTRLALAAAVAGGLGLTMASPAVADYAPAPLDVVGAGSDTVQNIMNFTADGKGVTPGYNTTGNKYKLVSLDATGDANDRTVYGNTGGAGGPLHLSVVYRAGASTQQRANGSGSGVAALLADTGTPETINWVRMSRYPKSTEFTTADNNGWGGLHVIKIANDDLAMARAATSDAVPLTMDQLVHVYQCDAGSTDWHDLNNAAPVGSTIVPEVPQSGSGTGDSFRADLQAANGGTAVTLGSCVKITEENDPTAITSPPTGLSQDAIQPMSSGRVNLYSSGYFHNPGDAFPTPNSVNPGVELMYGAGGTAQTPGACVKPTAPGQLLTYCDTRGLFIAWRETDSASTTAWQPGSTKNWVQTLFWRPAGTGTPYIKTAGGQDDISAGGATATYVDCGVDQPTC